MFRKRALRAAFDDEVLKKFSHRVAKGERPYSTVKK